MTLGDWLIQLTHRVDGNAVEYKINNQWEKISWIEYLAKIVSISNQIESLNIGKNQHIGIMSSTRWEWAAIDMAILGSRHVCVPMYPNLSDDDLAFTINHSEVSLLFVENKEHLTQISRIENKLEKKPQLLMLEDVEFDLKSSPENQDRFLKSCKKIKPSDIATIVYTSGTTGQPKGAVLLHSAIVSEIVESFALFGIKPEYKSLTFLPFAHVLGRIEHWGSCYVGHTLAYAESIERIKSNLLEVKPDFMIAVPRIFEKVYAGIMSQVETKPLKNKVFTKALELAKEIQIYRRTKESIPWSLLLQYEALSRIAFAPIQKAFGGRLLFAISGGAPLSEQLSDFFSSCGINILEGYGLTETCAAIAVNSLTNKQSGTVGRPIGDVEIRFAYDQEILVKSKKCLVEYYKNPEATKQCIENGFFATGDIGHFTEKGFLKITDRKKDLIKTAGGKYVAPQKLEGLMKEEPLVSQVLIHGDQKKYISALISVDETQIKSWAESNQVAYSDVAELFQNPALRIRIQKQIQAVNSHLASFEAIKKFEIVPDQWTVENGCLTPSLKIKRKVVEQKYTDLIREMYE
jgi:long-chain acyl-CoA synthetase